MSAKPTYINPKAPILNISSVDSFKRLTQSEKLYAYYYARASWEGAKATFFQRSYESPALFYILYKIFATEGVESLKGKFLSQGNTADDWNKLAVYIATFLNNCGNYRSFGDDKFVPEISKEKFYALIQSSAYYKANASQVDSLWSAIVDLVYEYQEPFNHLGFIDGRQQSALYSANCTKADAELADAFLKSIKLEPWNQRLVKVSEHEFHILVASGFEGKLSDSTHTFKDKVFRVIHGDFAVIMENIAAHLRQAIPFAANETERKMTDAYVRHFRNGNIPVHKESQIQWVKDQNPVVEANLGYIETYVDPFGVRGEFEGWVAIVDKDQSKRYGNLVAAAENLLKFLPWGKDFEKDKFLRPDFTQLEVLTFATSGTPRGINIPNYDDIRQDIGFKNVTLGNAMIKAKKENLLWAPEEIRDLLVDNSEAAVLLKVALHELLGHGSGKLLQKDANGKLNFDINTVKNPLNGEPIAKYYEANESWSSKFGGLNNSYEECRADSVALFLSCFDDVLKVLLPEYQEKWSDIVYAEWYSQVYTAILGLEFYSVDQKKWGQAHMNGSFVITQVLLEAGQGLVTIKKVTRADGSDGIRIEMDRSKIHTVGKEALSKFLTVPFYFFFPDALIENASVQVHRRFRER
jgi:dipeptidyl-peptidase-3